MLGNIKSKKLITLFKFNIGTLNICSHNYLLIVDLKLKIIG